MQLFTILVIVLLAAAVGVLLRQLRGRQLEHQKQELSRRLEEQVAERTAELRSSEERFRLLVEGNPNVAIFMLDAGGRIVSWNPGAERIKQYRAAEIIGRHFSIFYPAEDIESRKPERELEIAIREGKYEEEGWRLRKDGSRFWASVLITALRDEAGTLRGFSKVTRDVTDHKIAEENARQLLQEETARRSAERYARDVEAERERLRVTLTSIADAVISTDSEGRVVLLNPIAETLTGWTTEDAISRPLTEVFRIINEFSREPVENPVNQVLETGLTVGLANHSVLVNRSGKEIPIDDSAAPIRDADGSLRGVVLVFRDITEATKQRRAEESVRESGERLRLALDAGRMGTWEWDLETDQVIWSRVLEAIHGLRPGTFDSTFEGSIRDIHSEDRDCTLASIRNSLEQGQDHHLEYRIVWPDESIHWVEGRGKLFRSQAGKPVRMMGVSIDITERKRYERELKEADRRKDEFLATLAHELRNPLAPIRNAVKILKDSSEDAELSWGRDVIDRQVHHMTRLLEDLLDVSRISHNKLDLRKEPVALAEVIRSAIETSRPIIDAGGHQLTVEVPNEPIQLDADPVRLAQVFSNLLNNAARYTERGGHIRFRATRSQHEVTVSVKDDGIGIAPQTLPYVFDMFSQGQRLPDGPQSGLGIGLSLVQGLVELHGGRIEARSQGPGKGSEFIVRLPLPERKAAPKASGRGDLDRQTAIKRRLLIVDDLRDSADSLAVMLRMMGHEVHTAYDGEEGFSAAARLKPEIVLLDIGMPRMNGYEVAQRIRCELWGKDMFLVALTGWGQEHDRNRTQEAGFDHHIVKPADPVELVNLMEGLPSNGETVNYRG